MLLREVFYSNKKNESFVCFFLWFISFMDNCDKRTMHLPKVTPQEIAQSDIGEKNS